MKSDGPQEEYELTSEGFFLTPFMLLFMQAYFYGATQIYLFA